MDLTARADSPKAMGRRPLTAATFLKDKVVKKWLRIMKLATFFLIATTMHVAAAGNAQKVTLNVKNVPLKTVFVELNKQTGYNFLYSDEVLAGTDKVTIKVKDASIEDVLEIALKNQPLEFSMVNNTIVVKPKQTAAFQPADPPSLPPPVDVKGRIVNESSEPVIATVMVKGTKIGTTTNANGEFQLTGIDEDAVLLISGVSIEPMEIAVAKNPGLKSGDGLTITAKTEVTTLNEVIINKGYYTEKQKYSVSNVGKVTAKDIEKQPVTNPLLTLGGRVPGMIITQQSGVPGSSVVVQIRGQNSIANGNDPLYIIDGVPYTSQMLPNGGGTITNFGNPFNFISPSNIESITVLKDADATSIYGSRGANGVVLITTKKGKAGEMRVNANLYGGAGKITRKAKLMNTGQYLEMRKEAFANDARMPVSFDYDVNGVWDSTAYTDWQDELIGGTATISDGQVAISGGAINTQYLIGGGYHKETTVFPGDFANRKASVYFNINTASSNQKFKASLSGNYVSDHNNLPYLDLTGKIYLAPNAPSAHKDDGSLNWDKNNDYGNPFAFLLAKYKTTSGTLVGNSTLSYKVLPGLELKSSFGYTKLNFEDKKTFPTSYFSPSYNIRTGSASFSSSNIKTWIMEPQLTYEKTFSLHKINAIVGASFQDSRTNGEMINASGYTSDGLLESIAAAGAITKGTITNTQYRYTSAFGRINYKFDDKYIVSLTGRRDGSSRFGPGKQFANFGAIGAVWIFSNTKFIEHHLPFINFGKLRASYGTTGNDQIPDYQFRELYNFTSGLAYQNSPGLLPSNLSNPSYAWEVNRKLEFGGELGLFQDRVYLSSSYFLNRSSNQLVGYPLSDITGFGTILGNLPAVVENKGWEFIINSTNLKTSKFTWNSSINLTIARNKLVSYPNFEQSPYAYTYAIGQPLNIRRVFHSTGVEPVTGIYQFMDAKGNLTFTPDVLQDKIDIINIAPKFYGGFQNTFKYGNFQLDFLFQFVKQNGSNFLFAYPSPPGMGSGYYNPPVAVWDRWRKANDEGPYQKYTQNTRTEAYRAYKRAQTSNLAYSDASFIRLKNASLWYEFPKSLINKIRVQGLRVFVNAQNLFTITNYIGFDPENQSYNSLPPLRVITGGINLNL